jgi:hypothetical protein
MLETQKRENSEAKAKITARQPRGKDNHKDNTRRQNRKEKTTQQHHKQEDNTNATAQKTCIIKFFQKWNFIANVKWLGLRFEHVKKYVVMFIFCIYTYIVP